MKGYKDISSQIEFYLIDAFEIFNYLPIYYELLKLGIRARIVAEPCDINTGGSWFDYGTAVSILEKNDIPYSTIANENADLAITTQRATCLEKYINLKCNLQYGVSFLKNIFVLSEETCKGFNYRLIHSDYTRTIVSRYMDERLLFSVGYPKYDPIFRNPPRRENILSNLGISGKKPILVYLPTWDEHSSINKFALGLESLKKQFTILTKPHHCTARLPEKRGDLVVLHKISDVVVDGNFPFAELCRCADLYVADARSGAGLEALYINPKPVVLLNAVGRTHELFKSEIYDLALVLESPQELPEAAEIALTGQSHVKSDLSERYLGPRDGHSSERAADAIVHILGKAIRRKTIFPVATQTSFSAGEDNLQSEMRSCVAANIGWLRKQSTRGGVNVSDKECVPYPEVTGYFVPTLLHWNETDLALQYARWLLTIQREDGAFLGPGMDTPFAFDTGQIIRGLAAAVPYLPEAGPALERACEWILRVSSTAGRLPLPENMGAWQLAPGRGYVNEAIHLYVLPGMLQAAEVLNAPRYAAFARRALDYYIQNCNLTNFIAPNMLLHFYCYIQEALFDMGAGDVCRAGMRQLEELQGEDGHIPAYSDVDWVCTPGQIQAALVWFKLGDKAHALSALRYGYGLLLPSGGFPGSAGAGSSYFPNAEISWPIKFWLDALAAQKGTVVKRTENDAPARIVHPRIPEEKNLPLIKLELQAVRFLDSVDAPTFLDHPESLLSAVEAIPALLEWGHREKAECLADAVLPHLSGFLKEFGAHKDFLFVLGATIRAFRQPEILKRVGEENLKSVCLPIFRRQRESAKDNPGLFAAFWELAQVGEKLDEPAWGDCARVWALRQQGLPDQEPSLGLLRDIRSIGLLVNAEKGIELLHRVAAKAGLPKETTEEESLRYEGLQLALAQSAWRLGDDTLGSHAFRCGLAARLARQKLGWSRESSVGFLNAFSAMQHCRFIQQFSHFLDHIDDSDGRLAFVKANLPTSPEIKLLDMGTAKGRYLHRLLSSGFKGKVTGQDVHSAFSKYMPEGVNTAVGTILRSGWIDETWDVILLNEVLEHCVDLSSALQELHRILKPSGRLVVVDKNLDRLPYWPGGIPPWEQWFDVSVLAEKMRSAGFAIREIERSIPYEGRNDGLFFGIVAERNLR